MVNSVCLQCNIGIFFGCPTHEKSISFKDFIKIVKDEFDNNTSTPIEGILRNIK